MLFVLKWFSFNEKYQLEFKLTSQELRNVDTSNHKLVETLLVDCLLISQLSKYAYCLQK